MFHEKVKHRLFLLCCLTATALGAVCTKVHAFYFSPKRLTFV